MNYFGVKEGFEGPYHNGKIKIYWMSLLGGGLEFWYYEDEAGRPVEQGEGCYFPSQPHYKKTACMQGLPIVIYHDFDPSSFRNASHTADEFAIPEVCKTTHTDCAAPSPFGPGRRLQTVEERAAAQQQPRYHGVLTHLARMAGVGRSAGH